MGISAKEAAEVVGMSRNGIIKAIKSGRISGQKNEKGEWEIEPSELFRVYKPVEEVEGGKVEASGSQSTPPYTTVQALQMGLFQQKIDDLQRRLGDKDGVIEDLRKRLDREAEERSKLTALLTDARTNRPETPVEGKRGLFSWWGRRKGSDAL